MANVNGAPGLRFLKDVFPLSRELGISYYPYSSVQSGLTPSISLSATAPAATLANRTVAVSAGSAYLDGQIATLGTSANVTVDPLDVAGESVYAIYLNPTRRLQPVVLGGSAPTTLLNGQAVVDGDMYASCIDYGDYLAAVDYYRIKGGVWSAIDPSFDSVPPGGQRGQSRKWGNSNAPTVAATNFSVNSVEKEIYVSSVYPPHVNRPSLALLRGAGSCHIGTLALYVYTLPYTITVTSTSGAATHTVDAATAAVLADMVASAGSAGALSVALVSTDPYFASSATSSNVSAISGTTITTAANAAVTGTYTITLASQSAAPRYLISLGKSALVQTTNFVNP